MNDIPSDSTEHSGSHRGRLKIYLGAMPGAGKTYAMLQDGHDRRSLGEDVVIGLLETHGRVRTAEQVGSLEIIPRLRVHYKGKVVEDMNVDAVLERDPDVVLIDELAHSNVPGMRHEKRYEDVEEILEAGIDVITTLNIQHLESVKDVVERITGVTVRETLPDRIVDRADEVRYIDITPEALRKRMMHGNVYALDRTDAALDNFFRHGNLAALREIGLRRVADSLTAAVVEYPPENVLVAVSGDTGTSALIRRSVRLARRYRGMCTVLHVVEAKTAGEESEGTEWRHLAHELGCSVIERHGELVSTIRTVLRETNAQHVVLGESRHNRHLPWRQRHVQQCVETLTDVDLHVISRHPLQRQMPLEQGRHGESILYQMNLLQRRGALRVYLGYVPGIGTTAAALSEASRRAKRGTDVIVAALPAGHSPPEGVRCIPFDLPSHRDQAPDIEAILARNPYVCVVDDLMRKSSDGTPLYQAVRRLMSEGITVIGTLHLNRFEEIGRALREILPNLPPESTLPDSWIDLFDECELVDLTPEEVQERLRRGRILPSREIASALQGLYRTDVLAFLRESAFRIMSASSDRKLLQYMEHVSIQSAWETAPRMVLVIPAVPGQEELIRRSARTAEVRGDVLTVLSLHRKSLTVPEKEFLGRYGTLTHQLGGEFVTVKTQHVVESIVGYTRDHHITELILQRTREFPVRTLLEIIETLSEVDVHILEHSIASS